MINSIAGIVGGGLGGSILGMITGGGAAASGMDIGSIVTQIAGGGIGGGVVLAVVSMIRNKLG